MKQEIIATRSSSGEVINALAKNVPIILWWKC